MPTYAYRCEECGEKYEVFFKVKEESCYVVCPQCASLKHRKIMSVTSIGSASGAKKESPKCGTGCCPGCSLN